MQTRSDMEAELAVRLMAANNSSNFNAARLTTLVKDAELWATSLFFWPQLQRGRTTYTESGQEYYDYPLDFLTDSIERLYVDNVKYNRKAWGDYRDYVDHPNSAATPPDSTKHYFANFGRQFFVWPVPTTNGSNNLVVWGNIQSPGLPDPSSTTIFSLWDDSGNEAIVQKAFSVAMQRLAPSEAVAAKQDAIGLLTVMYKRVTNQMQKDQRLQHPHFNVFDMYGANSGQSTIGNFFNTDITW